MAGEPYSLGMAGRQNSALLTNRIGRRRAEPWRGRSLGLGGGSTTQMIQRVQQGFPYSALLRFHKASGLPIGVIAELIELPQRTLMRRKARGRLRPDESERLLRVSRVFEQALALFGGEVIGARRWLTTPSMELDNTPPLDFARTEIGAREVEELIGRLEHGVFT
jgi:putative toxin-antitoxin system antitoxin component (TIGR02293 family)